MLIEFIHFIKKFEFGGGQRMLV